MTLGELPERPSHDEKLGIFNPVLHSFEKGKGLKMALMIDHASAMAPP